MKHQQGVKSPTQTTKSAPTHTTATKVVGKARNYGITLLTALSYGIIHGWTVMVRMDVKHTQELLDQDERFLNKGNPGYRDRSTLNIMKLYSSEEREVIRTFDRLTYTSVEESDNTTELSECCNASWSGARVLPGMATCVGYLNQRRSCMLVAMCVPRDVLIAALKLLERVAHISVSLTVPVTDDCADEKYQNQALSNTAFLTPDGPILLHKQPGQDTVPMPSHPDAAEAPSPDNRSLPLSFGCYHVPQSALVNKAACVPTNPMSKTRVGLSSPIGCAMDHNGSAITQPRTHHRSQPGAGNQVVRFSSISRY